MIHRYVARFVLSILLSVFVILFREAMLYDTSVCRFLWLCFAFDAAAEVSFFLHAYLHDFTRNVIYYCYVTSFAWSCHGVRRVAPRNVLKPFW